MEIKLIGLKTLLALRLIYLELHEELHKMVGNTTLVQCGRGSLVGLLEYYYQDVQDSEVQRKQR
jgi:hypothetical protein